MIKLILIMILFSCGNKDSTLENKDRNKSKIEENLQRLAVSTKKYKDVNLFILRGNFKEIFNKVFIDDPKEKARVLEDFEKDLRKSREVFKASKSMQVQVSLDDFRAIFRKELEETYKMEIEEEKKEYIVIGAFSFIIDSYLISKEEGLNLNFKDYTKAYLQELKHFIDEHKKIVKDAYFSFYNTNKENFEENFMKIFNEVFNK